MQFPRTVTGKRTSVVAFPGINRASPSLSCRIPVIGKFHYLCAIAIYHQMVRRDSAFDNVSSSAAPRKPNEIVIALATSERVTFGNMAIMVAYVGLQHKYTSLGSELWYNSQTKSLKAKTANYRSFTQFFRGRGRNLEG